LQKISSNSIDQTVFHGTWKLKSGSWYHRLVSLLDDCSWELLADFPAKEALHLVRDTADKITELKNVNAYFMVMTSTSILFVDDD
jgi:hypothetical protein